MASVEGSCGKKRSRASWCYAEEKAFLQICKEHSIAEALDNCLTSAGNEEVYVKVLDGLVGAGFPERELDKIRGKYRKLKAKYLDTKQHNLCTTGRGRKEWVHYDLADSVWGHRPVASPNQVTDSDAFTDVGRGKENINITDDEDTDVVVADEPTNTKCKRDSKVVVKFKGPPYKKSAKKESREISDKYFIDKMIEIEEKRMEQQLKLERERLDAEKSAREAQMQFQREMMTMMLQMQQKAQLPVPFPFPQMQTPPAQPLQNLFAQRDHSRYDAQAGCSHADDQQFYDGHF